MATAAPPDTVPKNPPKQADPPAAADAPPRKGDADSDGSGYDSDDDQNEGNNAIEPCAFEGPIYDRQTVVEKALKDTHNEDDDQKKKKMVELVSMTKKDDGVNKPRGIQALFNSSATDCTLYSMFAFNTSFDYLFDKELAIPQQTNSPMRILMRHIVTPLRKVGFVGAKRVVALKLALQRVGNLGTRSIVEIRKPAKFLDDLLTKGLRVEPQLRVIEIKTGVNLPPPELKPMNALEVSVDGAKQQDDYFTVVHLIERWTLMAKKKLATVNNLVVQLDRSGGPFDEPIVILPFLHIELDHCMYGVVRYCANCINKQKPDHTKSDGQKSLPLAKYECYDCFGSDRMYMKLEQCSFCQECNDERHGRDNAQFKGHEVLPISQPTRPYCDISADGVITKSEKHITQFELFAIVCENVTGYVAYASTDVEADVVKDVIKKYIAPLDEEPTQEDAAAAGAANAGAAPAAAAGATPPQDAAAGPSGAGAAAAAAAAGAAGSSGAAGQNSSTQDDQEKPLWVFFDPEAILKEDVRGGFNVPQVHMVENFHKLIDYQSLDKSSGYINALDQDVNKQHQYRIMCESSALFYRPMKAQQKKSA